MDMAKMVVENPVAWDYFSTDCCGEFSDSSQELEAELRAIKSPKEVFGEYRQKVLSDKEVSTPIVGRHIGQQ